MTIHDISIPIHFRALTTLSRILTAAAARASSFKHPGESCVQARLIADMKPLALSLANAAAEASALLVPGGIELSVLGEEAELKTFEDLQRRLKQAREVLGGMQREQVDVLGGEGREILVHMGPSLTPFTTKVYVLDMLLPEFWFHMGMACAILRKEGMDVGKMHWFGLSRPPAPTA